MSGEELPRDAGLATVRRGLIELVAELPAMPSAVRVTAGDASIEVDWRPVAHDGATGAPATDGARPIAVAPDPGPVGDGEPATQLHHICAQTVGAFYRSAAPGQRPFVAEGDVVSPGQQVAILEAMKIMIPVEADCHGRVVQILHDDAASVEFGEPLLAVEPIAA